MSGGDWWGAWRRWWDCRFVRAWVWSPWVVRVKSAGIDRRPANVSDSAESEPMRMSAGPSVCASAAGTMRRRLAKIVATP